MQMFLITLMPIACLACKICSLNAMTFKEYCIYIAWCFFCHVNIIWLKVVSITSSSRYCEHWSNAVRRFQLFCKHSITFSCVIKPRRYANRRCVIYCSTFKCRKLLYRPVHYSKHRWRKFLFCAFSPMCVVSFSHIFFKKCSGMPFVLEHCSLNNRWNFMLCNLF